MPTRQFLEGARPLQELAHDHAPIPMGGGGAMKLMGRGYESDWGGAMKSMGGGAMKLIGQGAMKLNGGYEIEWGGPMKWKGGGL